MLRPIRKKIGDAFARKTSFNFQNLERFLFPAEIKGYDALRKRHKTKKQLVTVFYPGSANDVLMPLLMLEAFFDYQKAKIVLADPEIDIGFAASYFQKLTGCRRFKKEKNKCDFYFKDKSFEIVCHQYDVLQSLPPMDRIDVYFERAFQVFRQGSPEFFPAIKTLLAEDALMISDFGDILDMEIMKTPKEAKALGFYKNFSVFTKSHRRDSPCQSPQEEEPSGLQP